MASLVSPALASAQEAQPTPLTELSTPPKVLTNHSITLASGGTSLSFEPPRGFHLLFASEDPGTFVNDRNVHLRIVTRETMTNIDQDRSLSGSVFDLFSRLRLQWGAEAETTPCDSRLGGEMLTFSATPGFHWPIRESSAGVFVIKITPDKANFEGTFLAIPTKDQSTLPVFVQAWCAEGSDATTDLRQISDELIATFKVGESSSTTGITQFDGWTLKPTFPSNTEVSLNPCTPDFPYNFYYERLDQPEVTCFGAVAWHQGQNTNYIGSSNLYTYWDNSTQSYERISLSDCIDTEVRFLTEHLPQGTLFKPLPPLPSSVIYTNTDGAELSYPAAGLAAELPDGTAFVEYISYPEIGVRLQFVSIGKDFDAALEDVRASISGFRGVVRTVALDRFILTDKPWEPQPSYFTEGR